MNDPYKWPALILGPFLLLMLPEVGAIVTAQSHMERSLDESDRVISNMERSTDRLEASLQHTSKALEQIARDLPQ